MSGIKKNYYPLLLTGTIDAGVYNNVGNKIIDTVQRLKQYELSIYRYIQESVFTHIVFIENSGYAFNEKKFIHLAENCGKKFEFIHGKICKNEILKYGKSYGDAYLIWEALKKSKLLEEFDYFYKITGRIYLKNSKQICKTKDKYRNEFIVYTGMGWCLTNIFKANKFDYLNYLADIYNYCDEKTVNDIEIAFYKRLINTNIDIKSFEVYPYFDGIMGATLQQYSGNVIERIVRNIMARLHVFTLNSKTSYVIKLVMKLLNKKGYL